MQNGQLGVCWAYPDLPVSPSVFNFNFVAAILGFAFCHCGPQVPPFPFSRSKRELGAVGSSGNGLLKVIAAMLAKADDCLLGGSCHDEEASRAAFKPARGQ